MSKKAESIERELEDILGDDLRQYVLSDGTAGGPDGLMGLQLIGNCLLTGR